MVTRNEPDTLAQVQDAAQRLAFLTERLQKVEEENVKAEELRYTQLEQLGELRDRLGKLNTIADHYCVSIENSKANHMETKALNAQLDGLNRQKRILQQAIDVHSKKHEALTSTKKIELEQLTHKKAEIQKKYGGRVTEMR